MESRPPIAIEISDSIEHVATSAIPSEADVAFLQELQDPYGLVATSCKMSGKFVLEPRCPLEH